MADDLFCWPACVFILCEHMAFVFRCVRLEAVLRRMISVWHQSNARAIRKHKDRSALLSLSWYFDVILCSAASSRRHLLFSVCHVLMSIVLTPPILLPDYWLICPTCVSLVTLLICSLFILLVFAVLCQFVIVSPCMYPALPCLVLSSPALSCPALYCIVLPCQAWLPACFSPTG